MPVLASRLRRDDAFAARDAAYAALLQTLAERHATVRDGGGARLRELMA
jgi:hypothetical protein